MTRGACLAFLGRSRKRQAIPRQGRVSRQDLVLTGQVSLSRLLSLPLLRERERFCSRDGEEASLILSAFPVRVPLSYYHHG